MIALIVGSVVPVYTYHRKSEIPRLTLLPWESRNLAVVVGIGVLTSWGTYEVLHHLNFSIRSLRGSLLIFVIVVGYSCWCHPLRTGYRK